MLKEIQRRVGPGNTLLMVRGFAGKGQTSGRAVRPGRIAGDTLLFGRLGLAKVRAESLDEKRMVR